MAADHTLVEPLSFLLTPFFLQDTLVPTSVKLPDQNRILTFLSLLDDDVAEHTLRSMDPAVSEQLREMLANSTAPRPSAKMQRKVLDEFSRFFRFAVKFSKPTLSVHNPNKPSSDAESYELTDDSLDDLENMNVIQLTAALEEESARTCAILMKEMSAARTAEVLALMAPEFRQQVVFELTLDPKAPKILVLQIARSTVERAATLPAERHEEPDPMERMAEVLRAADKPMQRDMLRKLKEQDPAMTAQIQKLLFRFDDLIHLDDFQVRAVLGKVETSTISTALFEVDDALMQKVMGNLSKRARETLEEELSFLSRVPEAQLTSARETVAEAIAEVEMEAE